MKTSKKAVVANLYNPHEQRKEQLIESFVARRQVFDDLFHAIQSFEAARPGPHYLIEGQRGTGKTTLLLRLSYAVEDDPDLRQWLTPVVLKEEAYYGIRCLFKLWETIAQELEAQHESFAGLYGQMSQAYDRTGQPYSPEEDYEQACFDLLVKRLHTRGRQLILFVDNLGEMLLNFNEHETLRLGDILMTSPYLRLIGATPIIFDALLPEHHVLYRFFQTVRLEGLTKEETRSVLLELARAYQEEAAIRQIIEQHPGRIEALRILTGGVIRTIVLLFEIFTRQDDGDSMTDLDNILDKVTPLYQSRMKELTPLQRDVVHAMALHWDAISPAEIARQTRLPMDDVQAVIRALEKVFIIRRVSTDSSQPFYCLQERFVNIWYLMRLAPGGNQSKVLWLLHFLESWYDQAELTERAHQHADAIARGRYDPKAAYYLTEAFAKTGRLDMETEDHLIRQTQHLLHQLDVDLAAELSPSDKQLFRQAEAAYQQEDYETAISRYLEVKHKTGEVCFRLGECFSRSGYDEEAADYLTKAADQGHLDAMVSLGLLYQQAFNDLHRAEAAFQQAAEQKSVEAMLYLGNVYYYAMKAYPQAEQAYLKAIKEAQVRTRVLNSGTFSLKALKNYLMSALKGQPDTSEPDRQTPDFSGPKDQYVQMLEKFMVGAMLQLGNLYAEALKQYDQAETYYQMAADRGNTDAMVNLGFLYQYRLKDPKQAITYYTRAVEHGEQNYAATNLGLLYQHELRNFKKAEKYYLLAVERGDPGALNGLAWLYFEQKRNKREALHYARRAAEQEPNIYTAHTLACIYLWNDRSELAIETAQHFMYDGEAYKHLEHDILYYLMLLLAKQHYHHLQEYFDAVALDLRERFKPLYYAYLYFTEHPDYQKLPPELAEPVRDLIKRIKRMARDYK
jgi:TPR repeat protein